MADRQTLKKLFADDPQMMGIIETREQNDLLKKISEKETPDVSEILSVWESREQTAILREIAANKALMKGDRGDDGRTPVKGEDYYTESEAAELLQRATPIKGVHYFDGKPGKNGTNADEEKIYRAVMGRIKPPQNGKNITKEDAKAILIEVIEDLEASDIGAVTEGEVEKIVKKHVTNANNKIAQDLANLRGDVMRNYGGHGGSGVAGSPVMLYNLSSQLDGITKIFTIPTNTAITLVNGSSAPFIFAPTTDYTGSGTTTLTFTANVDAPSALAAGQTLMVQYY